MNLQKKLYIANGRWKDRQHIYVCGYSRADCIRILNELSGSSRGMTNEFNVYFNKGCWGNTMEGITPERGAWVTDKNYGSPKRIYPVGAETVIKKDLYKPDPKLDLCSTCANFFLPTPDSACEECTHYVG